MYKAHKIKPVMLCWEILYWWSFTIFSWFLQAFKLLYPLFSSYNLLANKRNANIIILIAANPLANYSEIIILGTKHLHWCMSWILAGCDCYARELSCFSWTMPIHTVQCTLKVKWLNLFIEQGLNSATCGEHVISQLIQWLFIQSVGPFTWLWYRNVPNRGAGQTKENVCCIRVICALKDSVYS